MRHENNGACSKCREIFDKFPGFDKELRSWFEDMQAKNQEFHCSDAGRGRIDQEIYFQRKASKAHYGESSHNFNSGLDTFWLINGVYNLSLELYKKKIEPHIPDWIQWGYRWRTFPEVPHFERKNWISLKEQGLIHLVE